MKKRYTTPEMETVRFDLKDAILFSIDESTIPSEIGGDDNEILINSSLLDGDGLTNY